MVAKKSRYPESRRLDKRTRALCVELARVTGNRRLEYCPLEPIAKSLGLNGGEVEAAAIDQYGGDGYSLGKMGRTAFASRMRDACG